MTTGRINQVATPTYSTRSATSTGNAAHASLEHDDILPSATHHCCHSVGSRD